MVGKRDYVGQRILAVDDNPLMLEVYQVVLGKAGYDVHTASDGVQALERLERDLEVPDLVLLDVDMPRMGGWELLEVLRHRVEWQDVSVIMVSAVIEPPPLELQELPVFQCYVTKKKTGVELLEMVEQVLAGEYVPGGVSSDTAAPRAGAPGGS